MLGYFDGSDLNESYYSQRELVHLKEVKALLTFVKAVSVISILFFFFIIYKAYKFRKEEREVSLGLILGGLLTNLIVIALLYVSATFDTSFIKFHELFFVSDTWLLAPTTTLIRLFSQEFFFDMLFRIILQVALFANLLVIGGILIIYRVKLINITRKFKDKYLGKYK